MYKNSLDNNIHLQNSYRIFHCWHIVLASFLPHVVFLLVPWRRASISSTLGAY